MPIGPLPAKAGRVYAAAPLYRGVLHDGAVRTAKTVGSLVDWVRVVTTGPPGLKFMAGRTERTVRNNLYQPLVEILGRENVRWKWSGGEIEICGHAVQVVGANDSQAETKIQGSTAAAFYLDELSRLPQGFYRMALSRLSVPGARWVATTNPDSPTHWLLAEAERARTTLHADGTVTRVPDGIDMLRARYILSDNPYLPDAYIRALEREYVGLWHDRYIKGLWVAAEGAIYPQVVDADARVDRDDWRDRLLIAIDYGTSNPTHAVLADVAADTERIRVIGEWRHDGRADGPLTDAETSARLRAWLTGLGLTPDSVIAYLDPSAASFRAQLRRDGWTPRSADNTVLDGIRDTATLLASRHLTIDRAACPALWREMTGYRWDEKAQARGLDAPLKVDDHGPDAVRYLVRAARKYWRDWLAPDAPPEGDGVLMTDTRRRLLGLTRDGGA